MIACDGDGRARPGRIRARRRFRRPHPLRGGPSIAPATAARGMASTAIRGRSSITAVATGFAANAFLTCRPMGSTASGDVCSGNTACPTPFAATPAPRWRRMACTDRGPSRQPRGHRSMAPRAAIPPSGPQPRDQWPPGSPGRHVAPDFRRDPARSLRRAHPHHHRRAITPERLFTMSPDNVSPICPTVHLRLALLHQVQAPAESGAAPPRDYLRCRPSL